jgi:phosphoribosylformylglycinamidine synthase subunit PurQ / glutaminase
LGLFKYSKGMRSVIEQDELQRERPISIMNFAVIEFPGSNCDQDCVHVLKNVLGQSSKMLWHKDETLGDVDAVILPGGFSYGDYLRCGAVARFSPVMQAVKEFAGTGGLVLGICNGFQILCEVGLLPGALISNRSLQFRCEHVFIKVMNPDSPFTNTTAADQVLRIPIAHHDGCYYADEATVRELEQNRQVLWQYVDQYGKPSLAANPNGSINNIAGICNKERNVAGLMPHPERASEAILDEVDGIQIFESMIKSLKEGQSSSVE